MILKVNDLSGSFMQRIEDPSPTLLPLFYKEDQSGIPINMREVGIEALKQLLLEACIRDAKWIRRIPNFKTSIVSNRIVS